MQIDKLRGKELDQLFNSILSLKDLEECYRFFDDLCTINEIQSLAQRLEVARMLREGNTYHKIEKRKNQEKTKVKEQEYKKEKGKE